MKPTAFTPWLLALAPLLALAAEPSPSLRPPTADAGAPTAPASCSLQAGVDRTAPSSTCTACHTSMTGSFDHGGHRVEVAYEPYGKQLRPKPEERGVNVVLPGGRITCLTCHDARSALPDHLAAATGGQVEKRLCTACHLFD